MSDNQFLTKNLYLFSVNRAPHLTFFKTYIDPFQSTIVPYKCRKYRL